MGSGTEYIECCVCKTNFDLLDKTYSHCPNDHKICKDCFLLVLQICYCNIGSGETVYKCPLCRNEYIFSNKEMNTMLSYLINDNNMCFKVCKNNNVTKKCQFENCGCRINIVDVITSEEMDLSIQKVISVANSYLKTPRQQRTKRKRSSSINHV